MALRIKFLVVTLIVSLLFSGANSAYSVTIDDKKTQLSQVEKSIDELNSKLEIAVEDFNSSQSDLIKVKAKLQKNENKMVDNQIDINAKQQALSLRVKAIYKQGPVSSIKLLLRSASFREFLDSYYFVSMIIKDDNRLVYGLKTVKSELKNVNDELNRQKQQQEILVNKVAAKRVEIKDAIDEKNRIFASVKKDLARLQAEEREKIKRIREEALKKLKEQQQDNAANADANYNGGGSTTSDVVEIGKKYLGVKYTWGGTSPETGFDCSGFVWYVYKQVGVYLPRTSRQQYNFLSTKGRLVNEASLAPGDLVFYGRGYVTDVKMYMGSGYVIGANGGRFTPGEVRILPLHYRSDFYASGRP